MKRKKIAWILLSLILLCGNSLTAAAKEIQDPPEGEDGMYTVRVYSGKQGSFGSDAVVEGSGAVEVQRDGESVSYKVPYGTQITVIPNAAQIDRPGKYYIRGIRESGRDNQEVKPSFSVTEDRDYVVAYGVSANTVAYTVRYLDRNGNALLKEQTYYGNVGDRLIIGFRYIEGYRPQAYNLAMTLKPNAEENIFPFVYTPVPAGGGGGGGTSSGTGTGTPAGGENPVTPPAGGGGGETAPEEPQGTEEPEDILDLDVPLADGSGQNDREQGEPETVIRVEEHNSVWKTAAICICVLLVAAGVLAFLWYRKRRKEREEDGGEE